MDDTGRLISRNVVGQPLDQRVHRFDLPGFRGAILTAPSRNLTSEVVTGLAKVIETKRSNIIVMQFGNGLVDVVV